MDGHFAQRYLLLRCVAVALCLVLSAQIGVRAQSPSGRHMQVGIARVDITPEEPVRLSGYGSRRTPSEGVAQRLWAKALAFGSDQEGPALLITADLIGFPGFLTEHLSERLSERAGLAREQLVLLATHTHTGPFLLGVLPNLFGEPIPPEHLLAIERYTNRLAEQLEQLALSALAARAPAYVSWAQGRASFAANRRVIRDGKWTGFGVNPDGPVDHDLPVLRITDADGSLRAVLLSYACHCTTLGGDFNAVHGDWAGAAAEQIEAAHPGAVAMVAIGAGADQNPEPRGELAHVAQHGQEIAREVERLLSGPMRAVEAVPAGRYREIELPYARVPSLTEWVALAREDGSAGYHAQKMLDRLVRAEELPQALVYPVQVWVFGDDLAMVFLAGEVVVDYGLRLKRELDRERLWVNAYANDLVCYIASERIMPEGGYEVDGSMRLYDRPSRFSEEVEDRIVETVHELIPPQYRALR